jgi:hypothetical protein
MHVESEGVMMRTGSSIPGSADAAMRRCWRILFACLLCGCVLFAGENAGAAEGYPGSTWGILTRNSNGLTGSGGMGWINQGVDWFTLPGEVMVNTYAEYRYRERTRQYEYFNSQGPAVGLEFKKSFLRLGMDYYWETLPDYPGGAQRSHNREYYLAGYYDWDLKKRAVLDLAGITGLPGSIWFNFTYDINDLTGSGGMGWINQGIDWFVLPGNVIFNTYAEYRMRERTKLQDYYNVQGPAVGLEFKKASFRLGADYYWEHYPELGERSNYFEFYLTWYVDWDLKHLAAKQ